MIPLRNSKKNKNGRICHPFVKTKEKKNTNDMPKQTLVSKRSQMLCINILVFYVFYDNLMLPFV